MYFSTQTIHVKRCIQTAAKYMSVHIGGSTRARRRRCEWRRSLRLPSVGIV